MKVLYCFFISCFFSLRLSDFIGAVLDFIPAAHHAYIFFVVCLIITISIKHTLPHLAWSQESLGKNIFLLSTGCIGVLFKNITLYANITHANINHFQPAYRVLACFGGGVLLGLFLTNSSAYLKNISFKPIQIKINLLLVLFLNLFVCLYVYNSKTIYIFDTETYWGITGNLLNIPWFKLPNVVLESVMIMDYNYLPSVLILPFAKLLGNSRMVFVMICVNLSILPIVAMINALSPAGVCKKIAPVALLFLFPMMLFIPIAGFVDAMGVVVCLAAIELYFKKYDKTCLLIGMIIISLLFFRRYFMFFILSFSGALLVCEALYNGKKNPKQTVRRFALFATGMVCFALYFFQGYVVQKLLLYNYFDAYSGYKFSLSTDFQIFFRYFGVIPTIGFFLINIIEIIRERKKESVFLLIQPVLCFLLFTRMQTHGTQHLVLYLPSFLITYLILLKKILTASKELPINNSTVSCLSFSRHVPTFRTANKPVIAEPECGDMTRKILRNKPSTYLQAIAKHTKSIAAIILLASAIVLGNTLIVRQQPTNVQAIRNFALLPNFALYPTIRGDISELIRLKADLGALGQDQPIRVAVLASSFTINREVLVNLEKSLNIPTLTKNVEFIGAAQVDKRDQFNYDIYESDYLLAGNPAQIHLSAAEQRVISVPAEEILNGQNTGENFQQTKDIYKLDNQVEVFVYKRIGTVTEQQKETLTKKIYNKN